MIDNIQKNAADLLTNCLLQEIGFRLHWPCQYNPEIKIPGPEIFLTEGNYWAVKGQEDKKYTTLEALVSELALMEEIRRIKSVQTEFDEKLSSGFFTTGISK